MITRYKVISVPIYKDVLIVCEGDPAKIEKLIKDITKIYDEIDLDRSSAATTYSQDGYAICYFRDSITNPMLAHELLHAVNHFLGRAGIAFSNDSDEAYTYLLEYLFEQFEKTKFINIK